MTKSIFSKEILKKNQNATLGKYLKSMTPGHRKKFEREYKAFLISETQNNFYIITGGPGSGKTAIIDELRTQGYNCVPEGARQVIKEQIKINGEALPWKSKPKFQKLLLDYAIKTYNYALSSDEITFFDCGFLELIAYNKVWKNPSSPELLEAAKNIRYNEKVFVVPPWREIFHKDPERTQTYDEAVVLYDEVCKVYKEYDYKLIEVTKLSVQERADFVLKNT